MTRRWVDRATVITEGMRVFTATVEPHTDLRDMKQGYRYQVSEAQDHGTLYYRGSYDTFDTIQEARARAMMDILEYTRKEEPTTNDEEEATGDADHSDEPVG